MKSIKFLLGLLRLKRCQNKNKNTLRTLPPELIQSIIEFLPRKTSRLLSQRFNEHILKSLSNKEQEKLILGIITNEPIGFRYLDTFTSLLIFGYVPNIEIFYLFKCPIDLYFREYLLHSSGNVDHSNLLSISRFASVHKIIAHEYSDKKSLRVFRYAYLNLDINLLNTHLSLRKLSREHVEYAFNTRPNSVWILMTDSGHHNKILSYHLEEIIRQRLSRGKFTYISSIYKCINNSRLISLARENDKKF